MKTHRLLLAALLLLAPAAASAQIVNPIGVGGTGNVVGPASATDGYVALFDGTTGKLLKDGLPPSLTIAGGSVPLGGLILQTTMLDSLGSTQGDILYRNGTVWTVLAPGTAGYHLATGGAGANPSWVNPSAGGTVTSIAQGDGIKLSTAPCTTTCTASTTEILGNSNAPVTGASYAINLTATTGDLAKEVLFTGSGASAWTVGAGASGEGFDIANQGTASITLTATGNINGAATMVIPPGRWASIFYDATDSTWVGLTGLVSLNKGNTWLGAQINTPTTLAISTTTYTPDGTSNNYYILLTSACASAACTLANPSAGMSTAGQSGVIEVVQPSSGGPAAFGTYGTSYLFAGGTSTITYSTAANNSDLWSYYVRNDGKIVLTVASQNPTH